MRRSHTSRGAVALALAATVGLVSIFGASGCQRGNSNEQKGAAEGGPSGPVGRPSVGTKVAESGPSGGVGQPAADLKADEPVETLVVKIGVGGSADLTEPVALDLGLGFPFWLTPVGREQNEPAPFGAVPQQSDAKGTIPAGSSASFTFSLKADPGQDRFHTSSQLLAGLRASDISRVGFASRGGVDWVLDGYEIQLNGKTFAARKGIGLTAAQAQSAARTKLIELTKKLTPLKNEFVELKKLVGAKLAKADDQQRLEQVRSELRPLMLENARLEAQLQGAAPWFEDSEFHSPCRDNSASPAAKAMKVVLITANHPAAGTKNYVYFKTGGHKYLLGSPEKPLSPARGPQIFSVNLAAGPLAAADVRGWAVGMLGTERPSGKVPDRWHPERILVTIDGRAAYDSDGNPLDCNSLKAIRVIPPAHTDENGVVVVNTPVARETFLWEAGKGLGLDTAGEAAKPLPPPGDPQAPQPEPGTTPQPADSLAENPVENPAENPYFPGETPPPVVEIAGDDSAAPSPIDEICPNDLANDDDYGYDANDDGTNADDWNDDDVLPPDSAPIIPPDVSPTIPPDPTPPPVGQPFQIKSVALTSGYRTKDQFKIVWNVWGDESEIDHYYVYLFVVRPEMLPSAQWDWNNGMALCQTVPAGQHSYTGHLTNAPPEPLSPQHQYLRPMVVAVPKNSSLTPHTGVGAARACFRRCPASRRPRKRSGCPIAISGRAEGAGSSLRPAPCRRRRAQAGRFGEAGRCRAAREFRSPPPPPPRTSLFAPITTHTGSCSSFRQTWARETTAFSATPALAEAPACRIPPPCKHGITSSKRRQRPQTPAGRPGRRRVRRTCRTPGPRSD